MQNPPFEPEEPTPEPIPFDSFLEERAKIWAKSSNLQWDVLVCFPTFRKNALEEWNLLEKERAAEEGREVSRDSDAEVSPSAPRIPLRLP